MIRSHVNHAHSVFRQKELIDRLGQPVGADRKMRKTGFVTHLPRKHLPQGEIIPFLEPRRAPQGRSYDLKSLLESSHSTTTTGQQRMESSCARLCSQLGGDEFDQGPTGDQTSLTCGGE